MQPTNGAGILSYGTAIPRYRITTAAISAAWGKSGQERSLGVFEKSVPGLDEDTATLSITAADQALTRLGTTPKIGAIYTGSESHPYAVKPTSALVGEALLGDPSFTAADLEFACKAGTAAMQMVSGMVSAGMIETGFAIGADRAQSKPGDALEYAASAAAAAFVIGGADESLATLERTVSHTYDIPDFWRREHQVNPSHGGRFTGEPAYFKLIEETVKDLLKEAELQPSDIDHVVFHMPNAKFPKTIAKRLGFTVEQLEAGFTVPYLGNSYSACSLVGLARVLDTADADQQILVCSFGSGAGADAFLWQTTKRLQAFREQSQFGATVQDQLDDKLYLEYVDYLRHTQVVHQ